jgi:hypothetical protein
MTKNAFCTCWLVFILATELPKFYILLQPEPYLALAIIPDQPQLASTRWWIATHIALVLFHIVSFYLFLISHCQDLFYREMVNKSNQIIAITVAANMTNSTTFSPIGAFLFNFFPLVAFVFTWRVIYDKTPHAHSHAHTHGQGANFKHFLHTYWFMISIASIIQILVTVYHLGTYGSLNLHQ